MDYGGILADSIKLIWRERKLLALVFLGSSLLALAFIIYFGGVMGGQMQMMTLPMDMSYEDAGDAVLKAAFLYLTSLGAAGILGLIGYFINLAARAGVVAEAARAWQGEKVNIRRGMHHGLRKAAAYFALDMAWALPVILVSLFVGTMSMIFFFEVLDGILAEQPVNDPGIFLSTMTGAFAVMGVILCLLLLYGIARGAFSPLMYQASVIDDQPIGDAIREGWRLSKANLGAMLVFFILMWAVQLGLSIVIRVFSLPFSLMAMLPWFRMMNSLQNGAIPTTANTTNWLMVFVAATGIGVLTWLWLSISQTLYLTFYARVYQELAAKKTSGSH